MSREVVKRTDGTTIDLEIAEAETYDPNAKLKIAGRIPDLFIQRSALVSGSTWKVEYVGFAKPGTAEDEAGWMIIKQTFVGNVMTERNFAGGSAAFTNKWSLKETYTYS